MTASIIRKGEIKNRNGVVEPKGQRNDVSTTSAVSMRLTLICTKFVANETKKVDKYISRLPDNIYGNMKSSKPKTLDETIELANNLMDQKLRTYAERQTDNKRKANDLSRNNHGHQKQPFKRQNVAKVYNMGSGEKKPYGGSLPKGTGNTNVANAQRDNREVPKGNSCFECEAPGHFKRDCPKLRYCDGELGMHKGGYSPRRRRKAERIALKDVINRSRFSEVFPGGLAGLHLSSTRWNSRSTDSRSRARSSSTVPIGTVRNEGIKDGSFRMRIDLREFISNSEEIVSNSEDRRFIRSTLRIQHLFKDRFEIGLSPAKSTRTRHSKDGISNLDKKEHEEHLKAILELLKKEKLYAKFSKCEFWIPKVQLLGLAGYYRSASILALPEGSKDFVVYCDASHKGLGVVLMQREKVIAYGFRNLKFHEKTTTHGC
ncbi:putative reverse transcriptase domain-containing protein [Tanacetum coccineum]|uniref:Reverse transcriptase domain-containing protein n=1 Tax=Tanacetum coccineum TaxID=301880 RepID=A0ABQ4YW20_9ASTR